MDDTCDVARCGEGRNGDCRCLGRFDRGLASGLMICGYGERLQVAKAKETFNMRWGRETFLPGVEVYRRVPLLTERALVFYKRSYAMHGTVK